MKQFFKDFKEFAMRGNVVDMAVGVVIGTAFGKIVSSLVSDIIMPALSLITGRVSLQDLSFTLPTGEGMEPIVLKYGVFLQSVLDFLIIAFSIFVVIKLIGKLHRKKKEEAPEAPPAPTKEEVLLTEIRDLLAAQKSSAIANETEADDIPMLESDKKDLKRSLIPIGIRLLFNHLLWKHVLDGLLSVLSATLLKQYHLCCLKYLQR